MGEYRATALVFDHADPGGAYESRALWSGNASLVFDRVTLWKMVPGTRRRHHDILRWHGGPQRRQVMRRARSGADPFEKSGVEPLDPERTPRLAIPEHQVLPLFGEIPHDDRARAGIPGTDHGRLALDIRDPGQP